MRGSRLSQLCQSVFAISGCCITRARLRSQCEITRPLATRGDETRHKCRRLSSMAIAKILALLLLAPFLGFCQLAELRGGIADPQRKSVAGATIHLSRGAAEIARIKSNGDGRFTFANVAAGIYTLRAEAHGFAAISRPVVV